MTFDWVAGLVFFATLSASTAIGRFLVFKVLVLRERPTLGFQSGITG